ncbi:TVP38/TMEM64 family protein [Desulforhopalus sp. IMCC35007]|uniref:TVP38/TMEM64 family protein n=1 Tax=Desulforhopalus sp. IMCC35007 TaxID=2569543 RepID=UPI0010AE3EFA|nr:TVP38/TMEM64 family protein [Desulforhopalus sp. IMCC35007]TKB11259.1 TVP38/TMEM64 family protein [Desulforhopalus sp. IMCC35007]
MEKHRQEVINHETTKKSYALVKMALLVMFIATAIYLVRFSPARQYLTAQQLGLFLESMGLWAPLMFVLIYVAGVCVFLPGTLLTAMGAALFGPYWGFLYVWLGAMIGASIAFFIGRYLGRDITTSLAGDRLGRYNDAIERNGFATVLYLRLIYFPFTAMNFGMGLTKVRFTDYFWGTALGITVGTFIFTFFVGTVKNIWVRGRWEELLSWQVFFSLSLFIFSFFIPKLLKIVRGKQAVEDA